MNGMKICIDRYRFEITNMDDDDDDDDETYVILFCTYYNYCDIRYMRIHTEILE